ncbi:acyl-CoA thioesterase [Pollutimonas bauzanensis]|uniref:Acyl-CoA thioester hydrolase n=1 Tax=Pollutimonas bauzanensis TaxID=658167 RepID=A0A1M5SDB7_9BURK|nr:thioesterase family protein [Pollutimonas bauzanensis]SHH36461.1 acyl-CoA thioester hydrolase [Pollutimonas bauzanensis]
MTGSSPPNTQRPSLPLRSDFRHFEALATRWMDCDRYGHVNNVVYYSYFDTAVNRCLIHAGALDPDKGTVIGLVVETGCSYFSSILFPQDIEVGIRVACIGSSSVRYELGIFAAGAATCCASGHFVHVYVDHETRRPAELPKILRQFLEQLRD